jgi:hypothetical protein
LPIYDRALACLLRGDCASALADYRLTLELAPDGFFTAAQAVNMLAREEAGEFPKGLYAAFATHSEAGDDSQRKNAVEQIVDRYPGFTPAWEALAGLLDGAGRLDAIDCGLAALPDPQTRQMLLLNKALTLGQLGESDAATALLRQLVSDPESRPMTEAMARFALHVMSHPAARRQE